ncbi:MAG: hypothetical protein HOP33_21580 [Verrucomicrobia bacterium]|nr:hypothetical protein [Verrucomicrobiota bacterium]
MKKCSYCGRDNADEALNCRECGTEFERPSEAAVSEETEKAEFLLLGQLSEASDVVKNIASLEVDAVVELLKRLKKEGIPAGTQAIGQEGGLDYRDIFVEACNYERACEVAEAWKDERVREADIRSKNNCPKCGSRQLEYVTTEIFGSVWKCKNCGNDFAN